MNRHSAEPEFGHRVLWQVVERQRVLIRFDAIPDRRCSEGQKQLDLSDRCSFRVGPSRREAATISLLQERQVYTYLTGDCGCKQKKTLAV